MSRFIAVVLGVLLVGASGCGAGTEQHTTEAG